MRCLVTGGAGFIGSHIVDALVKQGHRVRVFDNLSTGRKGNLDEVWKKIDFVRGDLREKRDIVRAVRGVDLVFHEAALRSVQRSVDDPAATHEVNVTGTFHLLLESRRARVRRVVYASSSSLYG